MEPSSPGEYAELALDSDLPIQGGIRTEIAALYLDDAMNGRSYNKRLSNTSHPVDLEKRLKMYSRFVDKRWSMFMYGLNWTHLLIIHWGWSLEHSQWKHHIATLWFHVVLEIIILIFYGVDTYLNFATHDIEHKTFYTPDFRCCRRWKVQTLVILIVANFIDIFVYIGTGFESIRWSIAFRPLYLVIRNRWLRHAFLSVWQAVKQLFILGLFLLIPLFAFSFVGFGLFSAKSKTDFSFGVHVGNSSLCTPPAVLCDKSKIAGNTFFSSYFRGLQALIVLASSANFPDIMMQSLHVNAFTSPFFLVFAYGMNFFVMPIIFATVYYHFNENEKIFARSMKIKETRAKRAAFDLIAQKISNDPNRDNNDSENMNRDERKTSASKPPLESELKMPEQPSFDEVQDAEPPTPEPTQEPEPRVYFKPFKALLQQMQPSIRASEIRIFYNSISHKDAPKITPVVDQQIHDDQNQFTTDLDNGLSLEEFNDVVYFLAGRIVIPYSLRHRGSDPQTYWDKFKYYYRWYRSFVIQTYENPHFQAFILSLTLLNISVNIIQLFSDADIWFILGRVFYFFVFEKFILIFAYRSHLPAVEILDSIFVLSAWIVQLALVELLHFNQDLVLVFRLTIVMFYAVKIPKFDVFVEICGLAFRYVGGILAMEFIVFYEFAFLGMLPGVFGGVLSRKIVQDQIRAGNDVSYWQGILTSFYYENNFNSWWRSMVVLSELTMVNNWMLIYTMYMKLKRSRWVLLFFYAFYIVSVLFVLNVIISVVVDSFLHFYHRKESIYTFDEDNEEKIKNILMYEFGKEIDVEEFTFFHNPPKVQFYQELYGDDWENIQEEARYDDDEHGFGTEDWCDCVAIGRRRDFSNASVREEEGSSCWDRCRGCCSDESESRSGTSVQMSGAQAVLLAED